MEAMFVVGLVLVFLGAGIVCIGWARQIQMYAIARLERVRYPPPFSWLARSVETRAHVTSLRVLGVLSILAAAFLLWAWLVGGDRTGGSR